MSDFDESKHPRDKDGRFGEVWADEGHGFTHNQPLFDATKEIERFGHLYRGMSAREFESIKNTGQIKAVRPRGSQHQGPDNDKTYGGTFFGEHFLPAHSYAGDPRMKGSTYIVEVKKSKNDFPKQSPYDREMGQWQTHGIPTSKITRAWRLDAEKGVSGKRPGSEMIKNPEKGAPGTPGGFLVPEMGPVGRVVSYALKPMDWGGGKKNALKEWAKKPPKA